MHHQLTIIIFSPSTVTKYKIVTVMNSIYELDIDMVKTDKINKSLLFILFLHELKQFFPYLARLKIKTKF